jgi:Tol biopolymer transport system component
MADLRDRLQALDELPCPDLWPGITQRTPSSKPPRHTLKVLRYAGVALVSVLIAAGIILPLKALWPLANHDTDSGQSGPIASPALPMANGPIYFRSGGPQGPTAIDRINADGSGYQAAFHQNILDLPADEISWAQSGKAFVYVGIPAGIYVTGDAEGGYRTRLTHGVNDGWPSWSPDGTKIAFSSTMADPNTKTCSPAGADYQCPTDIYVATSDGRNVAPLVATPDPEYAPAWSPDGSKIAYVRSHGDTQDIVVANADGTDPHSVGSGGGVLIHPTWSADSAQIAFASKVGIDVVSADGTDLHTVFSEPGWVGEYPVWSPDGTMIAFNRWSAQPKVTGCLSGSCFSQIYLVNPDGSGLHRLTDVANGASRPSWQPAPLVAGPADPTPSPDSPGSSLAFDQGSYASGEIATGTAARVRTWPGNGEPGEGPFVVYLVKGTQPLWYRHLPKDAVEVGRLVAVKDGTDKYQVSATFKVPRLEPGQYAVWVCNTNCRTGFGDLVGGSITVLDSQVPDDTHLSAYLVQTGLLERVMTMASANEVPQPESIQAVVTTPNQVAALTNGVPAAHGPATGAVVVVQVIGSFVCHTCRQPPGSAPITGNAMYVEAKLGSSSITDLGILDEPLDLARLGTPVDIRVPD